jgi:hypothetical protein
MPTDQPSWRALSSVPEQSEARRAAKASERSAALALTVDEERSGAEFRGLSVSAVGRAPGEPFMPDGP